MSDEKKVLTREEEADEIIKRLSTPPKKKGRRLEATWTIESVKDLETYHGLDLEKEIMEALSAEIAKEIDEQILVTATQWQKKNLFTPTSSDNHLVRAITLPSLIIMPCIYVPSQNLILK
jgi:hypothetical protein